MEVLVLPGILLVHLLDDASLPLKLLILQLGMVEVTVLLRNREHTACVFRSRAQGQLNPATNASSKPLSLPYPSFAEAQSYSGCSVAQAWLEFAVFFPQPPQGWDYQGFIAMSGLPIDSLQTLGFVRELLMPWNCLYDADLIFLFYTSRKSFSKGKRWAPTNTEGIRGMNEADEVGKYNGRIWYHISLMRVSSKILSSSFKEKKYKRRRKKEKYPPNKKFRNSEFFIRETWSFFLRMDGHEKQIPQANATVLDSAP